ncbi:hypothetical protein C8J56DRAFT_741546, partial [Mycena floridula]
AVSWWVSKKRVLKLPPNLPKTNEFANIWWAWWSSLNPEWRTRSNNGHMMSEGSGSWEMLLVPGPNGMLNVLACLCWWHLSGKDMSTDSDWLSAIKDVTWALDGL